MPDIVVSQSASNDMLLPPICLNTLSYIVILFAGNAFFFFYNLLNNLLLECYVLIVIHQTNKPMQGIPYSFILLKPIDCGYLLEPPHSGESNEHRNLGWAEIPYLL